MNQLIPLSKINADCSLLATFAKNVLDVSLSSNIADGPAKYVSFLAQLVNNDAINCLKESQAVQKHAHFGFIYLCSHSASYGILALSALEISVFETIKPGIDLLIVSGNLQQFRTCMINGSCSTSVEVREFCDLVINYFENNGLANIFSEYNKVKHKDGSYSLILRK